MWDDPLAITLRVIDAFERLGVPYLIGGSLASAVYGTARSTLDADLVAGLSAEKVSALAGYFRCFEGSSRAAGFGLPAKMGG